MANDNVAGGLSPLSRSGQSVLRVGTWNMSHWTAPKVTLVATQMDVDILSI